MKNGFIFKIMVSVFAATIISQTPAINNVYQTYLHRNFNIVSDAIDSINEIKNNNKPYKVCKTYNIGKNTITIKTKIHYAGYRKKPDVSQKTLHINTSAINADAVYFVYNSKKDKNHIIQTIKGSKKNTKIALNKNIKLLKSA
ncbi:hypothetical protein GF385_04535 [Candidatus Dependentiae bacterium]|nr:hypothetical protein [Candidatus Dependentiae bacterium]